MSNGSYTDQYITSKSLENYFFRPTVKYLKTNVGLKNLDDVNDVHFDRATVNYNAFVLSSDTDNLTSIVAHTTSSNSAYAFVVAQTMLTRNIIPSIPISATSSSTAFNTIFKGSATASDILADPLLGLGKIAIISIKKRKYGDFIRAMSFTATTNNGLIVKDACSASQLHGILVQGTSTAGIIYYDLGLAVIHGPTLNLVNSFSSISSVTYSSSIKVTTLAVFCTAQSREMNYTTNDSAFYNVSMTSDPNLDSSTSNYNFTASGFHWGESAATASHSAYYLRDFQNRNPFITTVGLYNDDNELLLVGKTAQPLRKPKNVPITIKLQYDF